MGAQVLDNVKDVAQILFWLLAASIAWLSYRQAKRSIFQPAKNEVFKAQIETLKTLLNSLNWKSSGEAWHESGLYDSSQLSLNSAFRQFAKEQFGADIQQVTEIQSVAVGLIVSPDAKGFELVKGPADDVDERIGSDTKSLSWEEYNWEVFEVSSQQQKISDLIEDALSNPVLPSTIIERIEKLGEELHASAVRAAEDIERTAREFPRHYTSVESLDGANLTWASNMREERGDGLFEALLEVKQAIRAYLKSDDILGPN